MALFFRAARVPFLGFGTWGWAALDRRNSRAAAALSGLANLVLVIVPPPFFFSVAATAIILQHGLSRWQVCTFTGMNQSLRSRGKPLCDGGDETNQGILY